MKLYRLFLLLSLFGTGLVHSAAQQSTLAVINTGQYPEALCNDGRAATYNYILSDDPGGGVDDPDNRKKWLVVISGGGRCVTLEDCANRWREVGDNSVFQDQGPGNHFNMVPDYSPRDFDNHGILDFDGTAGPVGGIPIVGETDNPFRGSDGKDGFNRVWVNYCSSDSWQGLGTTVSLKGKKNLAKFSQIPQDPNDSNLTALHFGGAKIVDAVVDLILQGKIECGKVEGGGSSCESNTAYIPNEAEGEIVLAGSSAGGSGTTRNIDAVARNVRYGNNNPDGNVVRDIKVYGIIDATTSAGILPLPLVNGKSEYKHAQFYTSGKPALVRVDDGCFDHRNAGAGKPLDCYATSAIVVSEEITTPYFVVQQSYDGVIHEPYKIFFEGLIKKYGSRANVQKLLAKYPGLANYIPLYQASSDPAGDAAEAYIRHRITTQAPDYGKAMNNPAGLFIPNYGFGHHQLMADSERFYTSEQNHWPIDPGSPELGTPYTGTEVNLPVTLGNFRRCVVNFYDNPALYNQCVGTILSGPTQVGNVTLDVDDNSRVINSTAP